MNWLIFISILLTHFEPNIGTNYSSNDETNIIKNIIQQMITVTNIKTHNEDLFKKAYIDFSNYIIEGSQDKSQWLEKMAKVIKTLGGHLQDSKKKYF